MYCVWKKEPHKMRKKSFDSCLDNSIIGYPFILLNGLPYFQEQVKVFPFTNTKSI